MGGWPVVWLAPAGSWRLLKPGTFVHARVNLYNRDVSIHPVEPPARTRSLAEVAEVAEVAAEQERVAEARTQDRSD
jgi:hypothetical protein